MVPKALVLGVCTKVVEGVGTVWPYCIMSHPHHRRFRLCLTLLGASVEFQVSYTAPVDNRGPKFKRKHSLWIRHQ